MTEESKFVMPDGSPIVIEPRKPDKLVEFFAWETMGYAELNFPELSKHLQAKDDIERYQGMAGADYQRPTHFRGSSSGYTCIPVLQQLWGLPLCNLILAYVHALHPTKIVVTDGVVTLDACRGRVTIFVDAEDNVVSMRQEIEILYGCGSDVDAVARGLRDQQTPQPPGNVMVGDVRGLSKIDFK